MAKGKLFSRDPLVKQYDDTTRSHEDMATEVYRQLKNHYRLNSEEIALLERVTGIDATILRLKFDLREEEKVELARYPVTLEPEDRMATDNRERRKRNELRADPVGKHLEQLIQSYEAANKSRWFWTKKKPVGLLRSTTQYLLNAEHAMGRTKTTTTTASWYHAYNELILEKIRRRENYNSLPFYQRWRTLGFTKRVDHLETAAGYVGYWAEARSDLINPNARLLEKESRRKSSTYMTAGVPTFQIRINRLWGFLGKSRLLKRLATISGRKHVKFGAVLKKSKLSPAKLAQAVSENAMVRDLTLPDDQVGIIQFNWARNMASPYGTEVGKAVFPNYLQQMITPLQTLLDARKNLQGFSNMVATKLKLHKQEGAALTNIPAAERERAVQNVATILENTKVQNSVEGSALHSLKSKLEVVRNTISTLPDVTAMPANEVSQLYKQLNKSLAQLFRLLDDLKVDAFLDPLPAQDETCPSHLRNDCMSWRLEDDFGKMYREREMPNLGALSPDRVIKNNALMNAGPDIDRDRVAERVNDSIRRYGEQLARDIERNYSVVGNIDCPIIPDEDLRCRFLTDMLELLKVNRFNVLSNYESFKNSTRQMKKEKNRPALESMGTAIQNVKGLYEEMARSAQAQHDYISMFLKNLEASMQAYVEPDEETMRATVRVELKSIMEYQDLLKYKEDGVTLTEESQETVTKFEELFSQIKNDDSAETIAKFSREAFVLLNPRPMQQNVRAWANEDYAGTINLFIRKVINVAHPPLKGFIQATVSPAANTYDAIESSVEKLKTQLNSSREFIRDILFHSLRSKQALKYVAGQASVSLEVPQAPEDYMAQRYARQ